MPSRTDCSRPRTPAASSALVAYPVLVEPNLDLPDQARWWSVGFALFALATAAIAVVVRRRGRARIETMRSTEPRPAGRRRATWVLLAAVPAALLIGVTTDITTDIAAVPFLWIVPLTVYLATLILAYLRSTPIGDRVGAIVLLPLAAAVALRKLGRHRALDLGCDRAAPRDARGGRARSAWPARGRSTRTLCTSTEYSLQVALGGAIGGIAAAIVAPLVFRVPVEGLVVLAVAVLLVTRPRWQGLANIAALAALGLARSGRGRGCAERDPARSELLRCLPRRCADARHARPDVGDHDPRP